jgi:hypothetical protein
MAIATLLRKVKRLQALVALRQSEPSSIEAMRADPTQILVKAGMPPDPWQEQTLRSRASRVLLLASEAGTSSVSAALALHTALVQPGAPSLAAESLPAPIE